MSKFFKRRPIIIIIKGKVYIQKITEITKRINIYKNLQVSETVRGGKKYKDLRSS